MNKKGEKDIIVSIQSEKKLMSSNLTNLSLNQIEDINQNQEFMEQQDGSDPDGGNVSSNTADNDNTGNNHLIQSSMKEKEREERR